MYRRCSKWSLRLVQIPEYFTTSNLSVHPFKALPHLQLQDCVTKIPTAHSSPMRLLERCIFGRSQGWIFDSEQSTEWSKIGITPPNYADRDRDLLEELASNSLTSSTSSASNSSTGLSAGDSSKSLSSWSRTFQRMVFKKSDGQSDPVDSSNAAVNTSPTDLGFKPSGPRLDRQYVHVSGLAVARIAANGFIWMQNTNTRLSDTSTAATQTVGAGSEKALMALSKSFATTNDDRNAQIVQMMQQLEVYCAIGVDCYEIILSVVDEVLAVVDSRHRAQSPRDNLGGGDGEGSGELTVDTGAVPTISAAAGSSSEARAPSALSTPVKTDKDNSAEFFNSHFTTSHI
jgi:hypothetical protein